MDTRYQDLQVTGLWELPWTRTTWWQIEQAITRSQIAQGVVDKDQAAPILTTDINFYDPWIQTGLDAYERRDKHDVAAFVRFCRDRLDEPAGRWLHFGVTSSDIVDTAQGMRFQIMQEAVRSYTSELLDAVVPWLVDPTIVLGRTHGQVAEPTAAMVRATHWQQLLVSSLGCLIRYTGKMVKGKVGGPVGTFAHNPRAVQLGVNQELRLGDGWGASQILPRGDLARWANAAAGVVQACAKVAMDVRLMNLLGELVEPHSDGQVGSSSMAHKNNPIRAEQIGGLARLAAGYSSMLQSLDVWLERDISHSCVERVAVPDLWHVTLHAIKQTKQLLEHAELVPTRIQVSLEDLANEAYTSFHTVQAIRDGMDAKQAREYALGVDIESYDIEGDMRRDFLSNWPG